MARRKPSSRQKKPTLAQQADRHALYEEAVQDPEGDIDFIEECYRELHGRKPLLIREDFCGTAAAACEWVRRSQRNRAIGVDLDPQVLDWGRRQHVAKLRPQARQRVQLLQDDVITVRTESADVTLAMNFSYWVFKTRALLRRYFENVHEGLAEGGLFIMDCFGGYDAFREMRERRDCDGFTYTWDQADYDPVSGHYTCHIHFSFADGSRLNRAFTYHWRLWTLPELRELLEEAGFARTTIYWQGTDEETGEGDGEFTPVSRGDADPAWIAYLVAEK